ncbi:MAG: FG-GAP-like repeat-containing protein [Flavobacteriaceae bacterium]
MKQFLYICTLISLLFSCSEKNASKKTAFDSIAVSNLSGAKLARIHCASCHAFVPPELLPKAIWKNDVLPAMGHRLGIYTGAQQPDSIFGSAANSLIIKEANVFPEKPVLAKADWLKITDYYVHNAPDTLIQAKPTAKIKMGLTHFKYREPLFNHRPSLTSMIKILPDNRGLVFSDSKRDNTFLTFLTPALKEDHSLFIKNTPIHYYEKSDTIYLTTIGKNVFPHDLPHGAVQKITASVAGQNHNTITPILSKLQRPVSMAYGDLNNDGLEDIVACEYGDLTGKLVWFENQGNNSYSAHTLQNKAGAITAIIQDYNKDGYNDIFVLMAQGDEGVFYYENSGDGTFTQKRLLSFLPLNGSQYIELVDFNNDGFDDIVYVCGDNADKTPILKDYHGIYIFLNDGELNFTPSYFYHLNGAYKAMPRDYDLDGDLDIAAISFFPDYLDSPEESFVYLENKGNLSFDASSFPQSSNGRWIVMDAADIDNDGDIDIALGSFVYFLAQGDTTGLSKKWLTESPSIILLENTTR